jgi:hypothetical protein
MLDDFRPRNSLIVPGLGARIRHGRPLLRLLGLMFVLALFASLTCMGSPRSEAVRRQQRLETLERCGDDRVCQLAAGVARRLGTHSDGR